MTSRSSQCPIFCASFNQDNSGFSVSTKDGFKIFDSNTGRLCYERAVGAFVIVEMLYSTSLLAIVGAGEQPSLSPRRLCLFNTTTGAALRELNFLTSILAVRLNKKRVVVVLQEKTYIYDTNTLAILDTIDTVSNTKGLCAFSPSLDGCFLALPASTIKGSVLVYNVMELNSHCEIDAHRAPLAAIALSSNGMYIATASEQGTIIRVHLVSDATKSYSFRRGTYPSTIFSLSFGPSAQLPDILVATSSSGSIHVFSLGFAMHQSPVPVNYEMGFSLTGISGQEPQAVLSNVFKGSFFFFFLYFRVFFYVCVQCHVIQGLDKLSDPSCLHLSRSRRSSSFLGSILPNSVNDVLDPAYHHVLRKAVPAGVKSHIVVRNVEKVGEKSSTEIEACRATLSVITYDGYFLEYVVNVNNQNESKWSLEREFNLLTAMSGEEQNFQLV